MSLKVICYKTSDGKLFEDQRKADAHQQDIIGELLDGLLANDSRGNVTRADRFNILINTLQDPELLQKVTALYRAVIFGASDQS